MKVTPLELRQRQFATVMRGYDRAEVNTILAHAADDYEAALHENERLRQELGKFEAAINEHRGQEKHLSNTLLTAQKLADDIRDRAQQDAARIVSEAEGRAALLVEKSQGRLTEVQREIDILRTKRREVEISIEGIISTLKGTIESVREQDSKFRDQKTALAPSPARDAQPAPVSSSLVAVAAPQNRA
jgi:cell division initiation protein